jgi:transcriptional regulator with XRE-family HTH domain
MTTPSPSPRHYIKAWRKHRGMTQAQLAELIGIARSYLTKIERGDRRYDQPTLEASAAALDCTPSDLISRDPKETAEMAALLESLTPDERLRALAMLKAAFDR